MLEGLVRAGMSVARLNFAHGDGPSHRETVKLIRAASERCKRPVAILQDLPGPKLRLGEIDGAPVRLNVHDSVILDCDAARSAPPRLPAPDPYLAKEVRPGTTILLGDGVVELEVRRVEGSEIHCEVVVAGEISSGKGINASGLVSQRPILGDKDRAALELGAELGVDLIGVSYVRSRDDLAAVRREVKALGRPTPLVAKIETAIALEQIDAILEQTDAVMIARGDLSLEIPYERVPAAQKRIVRKAIRAGKPVITATQMLQSMIAASRPTRAEATDVANAVLDGSDALMLSDETAVGVDPVRACRAMARIIEATEAAFPERGVGPEPGDVRAELRELSVFASAAVRTARDVGARAIVTWSRGGLAARLLSQQRSTVPIITPTRSEDTYRRLALCFGIQPLLAPRGRITLEQLASRIGEVDQQSLLVLMRHQPGDDRRFPWMALVRVGDLEEWSVDPNV
jgi:pyruvate kinase